MDRLLPIYITEKYWRLICSLADENKQTPGEFIAGIVTSELDQWLETLKQPSQFL
jgi:hypothetical protein